MQISRCQAKENFVRQASRFNSVKGVVVFLIFLILSDLQKLFFGGIRSRPGIRIGTGLHDLSR